MSRVSKSTPPRPTALTPMPPSSAARGRPKTNLVQDPMPQRVEPCLALLRPSVPAAGDWLFEIKWDGYRLAVHIEPQQVRIITRGGHDWTHRFPAIAAAARELDVETAILDGEAVVLDERGRSDFGALQRSLGGRGGKQASSKSVLMAFDLLYLDGHDLTGSDLSMRRYLLENLVSQEGAIRLSEEVEGESASLLDHACHVGLEGIIAKQRDRPYRSGRTGDWLKIKCIQSDSFVIVGYESSAVARGGIGSLLLAANRGKELVSVGAVGTGFNGKQATELRAALDKLQIKTPAVPLRGKHYVFAQPTLVAEIEFRGWTNDGSLRHASYKGLRDAADNQAVFDLKDRAA